jgi:hypothetical protein
MVHEKQIYKTLLDIRDNDYRSDDFLDGDLKQDLLTAFLYNKLVWIADNDRVIISPEGEKILFDYFLTVEPNKKRNKLKV